METLFALVLSLTFRGSNGLVFSPTNSWDRILVDPKPVTSEGDSGRLADPRSDAGSAEVIALIKSTFPEDQVMALAVAKAEDYQLRPYVHNDDPNTRDDSYCFFQINLYGSLKYSRPAPEVLTTPNGCASYARVLYDSSGWSPWTTFRTGEYRKHLQWAQSQVN